MWALWSDDNEGSSVVVVGRRPGALEVTATRSSPFIALSQQPFSKPPLPSHNLARSKLRNKSGKEGTAAKCTMKRSCGCHTCVILRRRSFCSWYWRISKIVTWRYLNTRKQAKRLPPHDYPSVTSFPFFFASTSVPVGVPRMEQPNVYCVDGSCGISRKILED